MDKKILEEKKKILESELQQKISQLQNVENIRNQYANEIVEIQGKIKMLEELIKESPEDISEK
jgi:hypothetical protein